MKLLCALGGHEAGDETVYHSGYYIGCCRRCETTMLRCGASWREIPEGRQMVLRAGSHSHSIDPAPRLSVVARSGEEAAAARQAARPRRSPGPVAADDTRRTNAAVVPCGERQDFPRLLALAALVGAGLQLALGLRDFRGF
jgi:hypothetical protein